MDRCMHFTERMLAEPDRTLESFTLLATFDYWGVYSVWVGRQVRDTLKQVDRAKQLNLIYFTVGTIPGDAYEITSQLDYCRRLRR